MVKCICINDEGKPKRIPADKWVKKGEEYSIIFTSFVLPQKELAFQLDEIDLDESCFPYTYFLANRFAFTQEELMKLIEFIEDCNKLSISMKELTKQTTVIDA